MPLRDSYFRAPSAHLMRTCLIGLCVGVLSLSGAFVLPAQAAEHAVQDPVTTITQETGESASTHPEQPVDGNSASLAPAGGAPAANGSDSAAGGAPAGGALAGGAFAGDARSGGAFVGGDRSGEGVLGETAEELGSAVPSPAPDADDASTNTAGGADNAADQDQSQDLTNEQTAPAAEAANTPAALSHTSPFRNAAGAQGSNFVCGSGVAYVLNRRGGIRNYSDDYEHAYESVAPPIPGFAHESSMDAFAINGNGSLAVAVENGRPVLPGYEGSYRLWVYRPQSGEWQAMLNQQNENQPNNRDHAEPFTVGAIAPGGQQFIFGYFKTRRSVSDSIELVLKANTPGNPQVTDQATIVLPWPEATALEFDGDIAFDNQHNLFIAVGEKGRAKAATFAISNAQWWNGTVAKAQRLSNPEDAPGKVWGIAFRSNSEAIIGSDEEGRTLSWYLVDFLNLENRERALHASSGERDSGSDMASCDQPTTLNLSIDLDTAYRPQDLHSLAVVDEKGRLILELPLARDATLQGKRRIEYVGLPFDRGANYKIKHLVNGEDTEHKNYHTDWSCSTGGKPRSKDPGQTLAVHPGSEVEGGNDLDCVARPLSSVGVSLTTVNSLGRMGYSEWEIRRVGSDEPPLIGRDCSATCQGPEIDVRYGQLLIQLPAFGEYVMVQKKAPSLSHPHMSEYRFTITPEEPTAKLGQIMHRATRAKISVAVNAVTQVGGATVTEVLADWTLSVASTVWYVGEIWVGGSFGNLQTTDSRGHPPHSWELRTRDAGAIVGLQLGYSVRDGYKPVDLRCIKRGEGGENLGEAVYPTADIQPTDGYIYVILESVSTATDLDCTFTVYRDAATVEWRTVDAANQHAHLPGTEWLVTPQGEAGVVVGDCVANGQCGNTRDVDPRPGYIRIVGLESSEYTLSQTVAPAGYFPSRDAQRTFRVDAANQEIDLGQFEHAAYPHIPLPLTGGSSADIFVFAGMLSLVLAGVIALRGNPVHPLRMAARRRD